MLRFLKNQFADAWQFFLVPGIAALLPWRMGYRWLRWCSRRAGSAFDESARAAAAVAPQFLPIVDIEAFAARMRLVWLIDATDLFLSLLHRSRGWRPQQVERVGEWPAQGPFIAAGFHHGNGHWVFKTLAEAGHDSMLVSARWSRADYPGLPLRYAYGRLRGNDVERLSACPIAYRPGAKAQLAEALREGNVVVGVIDMPPRLAPRGQQPVRLLNQTVSFPVGLLELARAANAPIVPYWMEYDFDTGMRRSVIGKPLEASAPETLQALAELLDQAIRRTPEAWFFWPEWPQWIADAAGATTAD
ncbi:MAG: hypothetical protein ABI411_15940 [Tahibacter sp.]